MLRIAQEKNQRKNLMSTKVSMYQICLEDITEYQLRELMALDYFEGGVVANDWREVPKYKKRFRTQCAFVGLDLE